MTDEGFLIENLLQIADKSGADVPFRLNRAQKMLDDNFTGRDLVPKARQEGISSYYLARFLMACLSKRNTRAVVISHDQESTQRMLQRVKYYIESLEVPPVIKNMSANEITFPKTNSMFYIGTAGSKKFGRGDTITHLHCSEYAYWPKPKDLMRGLLQAVPLMTGEIGIESTGNGFNDYYNRCMRAYEGTSNWALHFFAWHTFPEYKVAMTEEEQEVFYDQLDNDLEEMDLYGQGISIEQLFWRRLKLEEMDYDIGSFKQEYPMTLEECFQASGESIFHIVKHEESPAWEKKGGGYWQLKGHPRPDLHYSFGADVAGGVGKDSSVMEGICLETEEQVMEYKSNRVDPEVFAHRLEELLAEWGHPFLVVESNNHGILTLAVLAKIYPGSRLYSGDMTHTSSEEKQLLQLGQRTNLRTKPLMIGSLRTALVSGLKIYSTILKMQLSTFIEHDDGKLSAQSGCDDDTVIAMACAVKGINHAAMIATSERSVRESSRSKDPFSLEHILGEMQGNLEGFPIKPQHSIN